MAQARVSQLLLLPALLLITALLVVGPSPALAQSVSFQPTVTYASGGYEPMAVAVGDVNGDRIPDIVVANYCRDGDTCPNGDAYICYSSEYCSHGAVGVLLGNGDGTFQPPVTYDSGEYMTYSVALGDLNGDGKLDLALVNACGTFPTSYDCPYGTVDIMFGNGDGTFGAPWGIGLRAWFPDSIAMGDVNGDGHLDVAVSSVCRVRSICDWQDCTCPAGSVEVLLNEGYGSWWGSQFYDSGAPWGRSVAVADVNRDHKLDLLVGNAGAIGVLLGNGDGTFQAAVPYNPGGGISGGSWSITAGDVNGDGKPDLLAATQPSDVGGGAAGVLLGNGDGSFKTAVSYPSGGTYSYSVSAADLNGDGKLDLILTNLGGASGGPVGVLLGKGDGTFQSALNFNPGGGTSTSAAVADLNGDGKPDLVLAPSGGGIGVLLNNTPSCTTPPTVTMSATPAYLWPPNGKLAPVTISGKMAAAGTGCTIKTAAYVVKDEYGKVQPHGAVTLGAGGAYRFTIWLQASRLGNDRDGRLYTVSVGATSNVGTTRSQTRKVIVPHDQGH